MTCYTVVLALLTGDSEIRAVGNSPQREEILRIRSLEHCAGIQTHDASPTHYPAGAMSKSRVGWAQIGHTPTLGETRTRNILRMAVNSRRHANSWWYCVEDYGEC
jgi:hypothetical protein